MGSKGGGSGGGSSQQGFQATTSTYSPNPEAMAAYRQALAMAENVASIPYQQYQGQMTAGFTPDQMAAFQGTRNMQGMTQPYINAGLGMLNQAVNYSDPRNFSQQSLNQYYSPYQQNVIDATMKNLQQLQAQEGAKSRAQSQMQGTFGGSGQYLGQAEVARQQAMGNAQTLAGLQQQGYQQAVNQYNQQQQQAIATAQNAAYGLGQMGQQAQQASLQGLQALLGTGGMQQQLAQQQLTGAYNQWMQQRAYPYQQAAFYSGLVSGIAPNMGGTTNTMGFGNSQTQQQQAQGGGGGAGMLTSMMSMLPMLMSDERTKTNVQRVGKDKKSGLPLYAYDDIADVEAAERGDRPLPPKRVSVMAQDLEAVDPEGVVDIGGLKGIRPDRAPAADGGTQGGASGLAAFGGQGGDSSGFGGLGKSIYSAPEGLGSSNFGSQGSQTQQGGQALGALGVPTSGQQIDPGMSQFLQNVIDPQTADRMARAKWVNQPQSLNEAPYTGDNYVIPPSLMNDGGAAYQDTAYHPQNGEPKAGGGRVSEEGGGGLGGFFDLVQKGGQQGPFAEAPGNFMAAAQQIGPGKIISPAKDPGPQKTAEGTHSVQAGLPKLPGPGGGGGGAGGGGGGAPKMPEMKMPKGKTDKPTTPGFDPGAMGPAGGANAQPNGSESATPAPEPVSEANKQAGQGGFNFAEHAAPIQSSPVVEQMSAPMEAPAMGGDFAAAMPPQPEIPLIAMGGFGGFAKGGRIHKDGGGGAGGGQGAAFGGLGDGGLGEGFGGFPVGQGGLGDIVLGNAPSPAAAAGMGNLMKGQETLTGNNLVNSWFDQFKAANDMGPQKTPVEQGQPAMPDESFYTKPQERLPGKLQSEHQGEQNEGLPLLAMAGMGGMGMKTAVGLNMANQAKEGAARDQQAQLQQKRAGMLADPANYPVEGYYQNITPGMKINPATGLFYTTASGAYRGMPYKDGGRVAKQDGGSLMDRIAAGIAAIESRGSRDPYSIRGARSRKGDYPYGKYQIMGNNIPKWGAEAGFKNLTIEQFRNSPEIQEAVARHQFAKILQKSGGDPMAVAGEWLGGPGWRHNRSRDVLGTSVPEYQRRFARAFGDPNMVASAARPVTRAVPYDPTRPSVVFNPQGHSASGNLTLTRARATPLSEPKPKGLLTRIADAIVPSARAEDRGVYPGDKPFYSDPKIQKYWDERPAFGGSKASDALPEKPHVMTDREVMEAVGRGEKISYDADGNAISSAKDNAAPGFTPESAPINSVVARNNGDQQTTPTESQAPVVDPYGFGQLTRQQYPENNGNVPGSPTLPIMAAETPFQKDATTVASDAARPAQKYWGDYRDVEKSDFGDFIDELAGDVRKSDVAGTAKTPMGKFQGEGGLGSLFDMEGTLPQQSARGGSIRHAYRDGGGDSTEDFLRDQGIGVAEQGPPAPGFTDELSTLGASREMPEYQTPHMSFEGQAPYQVPENRRIDVRDYIPSVPKLSDYGLRMPELRMPEMDRPRFAAPELRVPELRNPRMNNLPDALWGRQQGPQLPASHFNMGPEMPAVATSGTPLPPRRPTDLGRSAAGPRHAIPHHAAPRHRAAPQEKGLYWGDWRDVEPFAGDVIGGALDELTGDVKSSRRRGTLNSPMSPYRGKKSSGDLGDLLNFARGGVVRHEYATDGSVDDEGVDPLGALEGGLGQLGETIGGMFGGDSEQAAASDRQPAAAQGYAPAGRAPTGLLGMPMEFGPISQALLTAGLGMMASDRVNPLQAIGEGGLRGMQMLGPALEAQREREQMEAQQQAAMGYEKALSGAAESAGAGAADEERAAGMPSAKGPSAGASTSRIDELLSEYDRVSRIPAVGPQIAQKNQYLNGIKQHIDLLRANEAGQKVDIKEVGEDQFGRKQYIYTSGPEAGHLVDPNKLRGKEAGADAETPTADISQLHGEEFLKQLPPGTAEEVDAIARGDKELPKGVKSQPLIKLVYQYKPDYNEALYQSRKKMRDAYSPEGKIGQQLSTTSAALGHAERLLDTSERLSNWGVPLANVPKNMLKSAMGDSAMQDFTQTRDALLGEMEKYFKGGAPADSAVKRALENISPNSSPQQIAAAVNAAVDLMETKTKGYLKDWESRFGDVSTSGANVFPHDMDENYRIIEDIKNRYRKIDPKGASFYDKKESERHATTPEFSEKQIVKTGIYNGRKVVKYSDGTMDYAD